MYFNMRKNLVAMIFAALLLVQANVNAQNINVENRLVDAVQMYNDGKYETAIYVLDNICKQDPDNDAAYYYLGLCHAMLANLDQAEKSLRKAVRLDSTNYWYQDRLATLYRATGSTDLSVAMYEKMMQDFPKKDEPYYQLANMYISDKEYGKALDVISEIESMFGKSDGTVLTKFDIMRQQGKDEDAYKMLEEYCGEYSSPQALVMLGDWQMGMYNDSLALTYYNEALQLDRAYAPALLGKAETFRITRKYPDYFSTLDLLMGDSEVAPAPKSNYLEAVVRQSDPRFINSFKENFDSTMNLAVSVHPNDSSILRIASLYYYATDRKDEACALSKRDKEAHPDNINSNVAYIQMLYYSAKWKEVEKECYEAFDKFKEPGFLEYASMAQYQTGDYRAVIANCEKLVKIAPKDSAICLSAYQSMGDMYHKLGEKEKSYKAYENALKINPDCCPALNNYAYFLSLEKKKLKKAYTMSKRTVELEPDNATYLDTFGWILHLQGKNLEAKPFFKHAMLYGGKDSATVLEHYAIVLEKLGETDLAKVYFQQAKKKKATNPEEE